INDSRIGSGETLIRGTLTDNHLVDAVEVCEVTANGESCAIVDVTIDRTTLPTSTVRYADIPANPVALGAREQCYGGSELSRIFTVAEQFTVADVAFGLTVEHPYRFDVTAWLVAPSGRWINLVWDGAPRAANYDVLFSDAAFERSAENEVDHNVQQPYYEHILRPAEPLGTFQGEQAQGDWVLELCDSHAPSDDGQYIGSQLILTPDTLPENTIASWNHRLLAVAGLEDESLTVKVYGIDSVGNRTGSSTDATVIVDVVAPEVIVTELITQVLYSTIITDDATLMGGTATDASGIMEAYATVRDAMGTQRVPISIGSDGSWTVEWQTQFVGSLSVSVYVADSLGNVRVVGPASIQVIENLGVDNKVYLPLVVSPSALGIRSIPEAAIVKAAQADDSSQSEVQEASSAEPVRVGVSSAAIVNGGFDGWLGILLLLLMSGGTLSLSAFRRKRRRKSAKRSSISAEKEVLS
ncbi:MAG: proprotein convertase P-domain-containing protein, partial [Planctomycetota bacterium]